MSLRDALDRATQQDPLGAFLIADIDSALGYYGYATFNGAWVIKKFDGSAMRYAAGVGDYSGNWAVRDTLSYTTPDQAV